MATSSELAAKIAEYDANKKSSADILNEAMGQYGVPEIRNRVAGLRTTLSNTESALNAVEPSVTGRTSRSLVTDAARKRIVAQEREPLSAQYSSQAGVLSNESANLSAQEAAAKLLAESKVNDYTTGRNALQSQYDTQYTREQNDISQANAREAAAQAQANADREYQLKASDATSKKYFTKASESGGTNFYDPNGNPITAAQYIAANGGSSADLASFLESDTDKTSKKALEYWKKNGTEAAKAKYPYIFAGI